MTNNRILFLEYVGEETHKLYDLTGTRDWNDSGFDLHFPKDIVCEPKKRTLIKMGVKAVVGQDKDIAQPRPYYLYPRSSIGKTPLRMSNSVGIIDLQYRGELCVQVDNISDEPYQIKKGQRLFQICAQDLEPFHNVQVAKLPDTKRGEQGLGSTGI